MKKAILLLGMLLFTVGVVFFRNADADTVLIKQRVKLDKLLQDTEEVEKVRQKTITESAKEEEAEAEVTIPVEADSAGSVTFMRLSLDEQKVYSEILTSLLRLEQETVLSTKDTSLIDKAFHCVMCDHPEIFYVDGYKYTEYSSGETVEKIIFSGNYIYDKQEINSRQAQIDKKVDAYISAMPNTDDEYEKVKYIYETVILQTEYDTNAPDHQNICSVFLNGRSVCQGYAKAIQYLLREAQIESLLVTGTVREGDGHAWNLVSVNDNWYYLDATWGDAFYLFAEEEEPLKEQKMASVNYDYFCVTTEQIEQTHVIDMPVALPLCTSLADNYYVREGLYFTSYDADAIRTVFERAQEEGKETVTLKCSDNAVYESVCEELLKQQKIFDFILENDGAVAYTDNAEQCSITFWL